MTTDRNALAEKHVPLMPALPEAVQDWPPPRGQKFRPARWRGCEDHFRTYFESALAQDGEDALTTIINPDPRGPGAHLTRWFARGVPMHATGDRTEGEDGRTWFVYRVPARAALHALDAGDILCTPARTA